MTLATMADRSLPLAERGLAMFLCWDMDDAHEAARAELLADVAATDRLARAAVALDADDWGTVDADGVPMVAHEHAAALEAYRARMAQGVGDA